MTRLDNTDHFVNKQVVETAGVLELLRTGVHSGVDAATLGGQRDHARALALDLVNHRVPTIADQDAVAVGGDETLVLSDPPSYPLAYHALSCGMFARAVDLLGDRVASSGRDALRAMVRASWWLAGPDGDLAWMGRSQEQAWALAAHGLRGRGGGGGAGVGRGAGRAASAPCRRGRCSGCTTPTRSGRPGCGSSPRSRATRSPGCAGSTTTRARACTAG